MTDQTTEASPLSKARIAGVVYLLYFLTAILGAFFVKGLVVSGDAAATARNILERELLFRLSLATSLISIAFYIALTALFYELFRPVNRNISLLSAFFSLVGCTIQAVFNGLHDLAPLVILGSARYLSVFKVEQLQAVALMVLKLSTDAFNMGLVFFGFYDILIGYLIFKSAFLPRILGLLMAAAGFGWLTFLSPPLADHLSPWIQVLGFLAEVLLMLWLLGRGVDVERWKEHASAAGERQ